MFRVITISRQYGSGGGEIARRLAERLGWRLIDQSVVNEIAARARVSPSVAAEFDERVDPWLHRMVKALVDTVVETIFCASGLATKARA